MTDVVSSSVVPPSMYLVLTNISKRPNIRKLLQIAAAFDCAQVLMVGQKSFDLDPDSGGTDIPTLLKSAVRSGKFVIRRFDKWDDCTEYLKSRNIRLVGVEIHEQAQPIEVFTDGVDTAFLMGNEGTGLNEKHMKSCDAFVRIPQYGGGTASLNVYVAASIVLYRFHKQLSAANNQQQEPNNNRVGK